MDMDSEVAIQALPKNNEIVSGFNKKRHYKVLGELGKGAFGAVYEVLQVADPRAKGPHRNETKGAETADATVERLPTVHSGAEAHNVERSPCGSGKGTNSGRDNHSQQFVPPPTTGTGTPRAARNTADRDTGISQSNIGCRYAMKCELHTSKMRVLKTDMALLKLLTTMNGRHFCLIFDRARTEKYDMIIMTLVGTDLATLRRSRDGNHFTTNTALRVAIQCLEAVEDLHKASHLHRDIKPQNFAIGTKKNNEQTKIFMLDFGLARKFKHEDGRLRRGRQRVGFRGTIRYAPIASHRLEEMGRKDDLESWLYMTIEMTSGTLPWRQCTDKNEVGKVKEASRSAENRDKLLVDCPRSYGLILTYLDQLPDFTKIPDYEYLYRVLNKSMKSRHGNVSDRYDWEETEQQPATQQPRTTTTQQPHTTTTQQPTTTTQQPHTTITKKK